MSDLRDILDRKRAEARPAPGAFERLETRRRRRDFKRRATAGTAALLAVVVGAVVAIRLFPTKIEPASPPVVARTVVLDRTPAVVASGLGSLWVAEEDRLSPEGAEFQADERLLRLDPETGRITADVPLAVAASGSAMEVGEGAVWLGGLGTVSRIDPESGAQLEAFGFGENPTALGLARGEPESSPLRGVWVATPVDDSLHRIIPSTGKVETISSVGDRPLGVAVGEGAVWVALGGESAVARFDATRGQVVQKIGLPAPTGPIAVGAGAVWVAVETGVARIDPTQNRVVTVVTLPSPPHTLALGPAGLWAATDAGISLVDPETNVPSRVLDVTDVRGFASTSFGLWAATEQELLLLRAGDTPSN